MMKITKLVPTTHLGPRLNRIQQTDDLEIRNRLKLALPYVQPGSRAFVLSLCENYDAYGNWTPRQSEHARRMLELARQAYREAHPKFLQGRIRTQAPRVTIDGINGLQRLFEAAGAVRKRPVLLMRVDGIMVKLVPGRDPGTIAAFDREFTERLALIKPDGALVMHRGTIIKAQDFADAASWLGENPATAARAYGESTKTCMCCGQRLTHPVSKKYGIGPICNTTWRIYPEGEYHWKKGSAHASEENLG